MPLLSKTHWVLFLTPVVREFHKLQHHQSDILHHPRAHRRDQCNLPTGVFSMLVSECYSRRGVPPLCTASSSDMVRHSQFSWMGPGLGVLSKRMCVNGGLLVSGTACVSSREWRLCQILTVCTCMNPHSLPFRDATWSKSTFDLHVKDCWSALQKASEVRRCWC